MRAILPIVRDGLIRPFASVLISLLPIWLRPARNHPFLRACVPVLITYSLTVIGAAYVDLSPGRHPLLVIDQPETDGAVGVAIGVLLFTIIHAAVPVIVLTMVYGDRTGLPGIFCYLTIIVWFGWPILLLADLTGWLCLVAAAMHVALAGRGERYWVFVEYGSTSLALLLFVLNFGEQLFPWGLIVVPLQSLLLALLTMWGRKLYDALHRPIEAAGGDAVTSVAEEVLMTTAPRSRIPRIHKGKKKRNRS